jgi:RNase P/RNase MRP subunit POP5
MAAAAAIDDEYISVPDDADDARDDDTDEAEGEARDADEDADAVSLDLAGASAQLRCATSRHYMRVSFGGSIPSEGLGVQMAIMQSLRVLYGQAGAADAIEILAYSASAREALIAVPSRAATRVRNAITILSEWELAPMRAQVIQSSPYLLSMVTDVPPL